MKRFYVIFTIVLLLVAGCKTESGKEGNNRPNTPTNIEIKEGCNEVCELTANSSSTQITFEVDYDWEIKFVTYDGEAADWIDAVPSRGVAGKHTVKLTAKTNESVEDRLVRLEVRGLSEESRAEGLTNLISGAESTFLCISLLQYGYYELKYGKPIELKLNSELRVEQCINTYLADKGLDYNDVVYLEIFGPMTNADFAFINEKLPNITVLDLTASDVEVIPQQAFSQKQSLHYIKLPFKLRRIESNAFYQSGIKNVNLYMPPFLQYIGWNAFAYTNLSGTIIFPGTINNIELSGGALEGNGVMSAHFCEGISHIDSDIVSPFPSKCIIFLPSTLVRMSAGITEGGLLIYCYAPIPPKTANYELDASVEGVLIPVNCLNAYKDFDTSPWHVYYSDNPQYNKLYDVLGTPIK